jgi:hypothetical protein
MGVSHKIYALKIYSLFCMIERTKKVCLSFLKYGGNYAKYTIENQSKSRFIFLTLIVPCEVKIDVANLDVKFRT